MKKIGIATLAVTSYLYFANLGLNNLFNRREYRTIGLGTEYHCVERPDGAFSHTEYCRYKSGENIEDEVSRFNLFRGSKVYRDGGLWGRNDGLADSIHLIPICGSDIVLERNKDYNLNKEEFDKADKELAKTKERFKKFFK